MLSIPHRYGGYALPGLEMNRRVRPSKKARKIAKRETLVPDLCHSESRLVIEYDSNAEHLTARQATLDATKRMALESDGLKVITVTTSQLASASAMRHVAQEAHARRGTRLRLRCKNFALRQKSTLSAEMVHGRLSRRGVGCGAAVLLSVKRAARRGVLAGVPSHGF